MKLCSRSNSLKLPWDIRIQKGAVTANYFDFANFGVSSPLSVLTLVEKKRSPMFDLPKSNKILKILKAHALIHVLKHIY